MIRPLSVLSIALILSGCGSTTKDTMERDKMPELAPYPAPPAGAKKARAGVMDFEDKSGARVADAAGEQLETQVVSSDRFNLIDRMGMKKLVHEQGLEGIVDPSELAKPGRIRGIDYMFMGAVTNFRIMTNTTSATGGVFDHVAGPMGVKYNDRKTVITTDVGVDIKLVNTTTGEIVSKEFGEVKRTIEASSWGLKILDIGGNAQNNVKIDRDSQGKLLRLAVDEALRKMLPRIDAKLSQPAMSVCPKCKTEIAAGAKFCAKCGTSTEAAKCSKCSAELEPGAKFCGKCGEKVGQ
jgi:curli biogenesis system outer membrane secretion channel CsgG